MVETDFEEELENARKLIARMRFTLTLVGLWPLDPTYIRFFIWIIYFGLYICMEFADLYTVSGNLELMITNLMESSFTFMIFVGMIVIRFSKTLRQLIISVEAKMQSSYYNCVEEKIIFLHYIKLVTKFHKVSTIFSWISTVIYYFKPGIEFTISYLSSANQTIPLQTPTRINFYRKSDTNFQNAIIYILVMPVTYTGLFRPTIITLLMMLVFTVCSQLAILSNKVQQCTPNRSNNHVFSQIVEQHHNIISMSHSIEKSFSYLLLFELTILTILLGLIAYNGVTNFDHADKLSLLNMLIFGITTLIVIFGDCLIGEYLITESTNLYMSFAKCMWYEMTITDQKSLLICMNYSIKPLHITAGKIYDFSLSGYTSILKTSMAYVSMLRSVEN